MALRPNFDPYGGRTPVVDSLIGDAYPTVKAVARHLPYLVYLAQNFTALRPLNVEFQRNDETQSIDWRYVQEGAEWQSLIPYTEINGPTTEMQEHDGYIQYRPMGTDEWSNLLPISAITGKTAEMQQVGNSIQWRLEGENWNTLYDLTTVITDSSEAKAASVAASAQLVAISERQDELEVGQQTNAIYADTLAALQSVVGTFVGQGAFALNGTGAGQYRWNGTAWEFLRADMLAIKANKTDVASVAGVLSPTVNGNYLEVDSDPEGNVAFAVHSDGTREFLRTKIASTTITRVSENLAAIDGRIKWHDNYQEWSQNLTGEFENALLLEIDAFGRVGRIVWADGSVWPDNSEHTPTDFVLIDQITLPNGAQGQNPNGGWTCTGLDIPSTGKWRGCPIVGNDGRVYEGTQGGIPAAFQCSLVCTTPDFRRILWEIPCNTAMFPGIESIQGVAWDTSDGTIWFADKTNKTIRHITVAGAKLLDEIVVSHTLNGIAYRPDLDAIYTADEGSSTIHLISCSTGEILRTQTGISSQADQLHYEAASNRLWVSVGSNGQNGSVLIYDADTLVLQETHVLSGSQAIEGIYYNPVSNVLTAVNDGAFHTSANPPLALACKYNFQ